MISASELKIERTGVEYVVRINELDTFGYYGEEGIPLLYRSLNLNIYDLNQDGEAEIVLALTYVGAYASELSTILYFDEMNQTYKNTVLVSESLRLLDINDDGLIETLERDTDFNILGLDGAHAISVLSPMRVLGFRDNELRNISAEFPQIIEAAASNWFTTSTYLENIETCDIYSWGAYIAEMHQLGRGAEAWQLHADFCAEFSQERYSYERHRAKIGQALNDFGYLNADPRNYPTISTAHPPFQYAGNSYIGHGVQLGKIRLQVVDAQTIQLSRNDASTQQLDISDFLVGAIGRFEVSLIDLNDDDEPEAIVQVGFPAGFWQSGIYFYDAEVSEFRRTQLVNHRLLPRDLDRNSQIEFYSLDEAFSVMFGAPTIENWISPVKILGLREGELIDVTGDFPSIIRDDARRWRAYATSEQVREPCLGVAWGAYLANMYRLSQQEMAWRIYETQCGGTESFQSDYQQIYDGLLELGYAK